MGWKMKKVVISVIGAFFIANSFVGCAGGPYRGGSIIPSPEETLKMMMPTKSKSEVINSSNDKAMTEAFLNGFKTGRDTSIEYHTSDIAIDKLLYQTDSFIKLSKAENFYKSKSSSFLNDDVATLYKKVVTSRGNHYKVYKGAMNLKILQSIYGSLKRRDDTKLYGYGLDYAIIEFDKNNKMVSALARVVEVEPSVLGMQMGDRDPAVEISQTTMIFFKDKVDVLNMMIPNSYFSDYLVK